MKPLRILIADDHDIVREGLRMLLKPQKHWEVCGEAATGAEAVAMAKELKPDIALLDYTMPELNGLQAARQIRRLLPECAVALLTMHNIEWLAREAAAVGVRAVLLKTNVRRHLVAAITALAQHNVYLGSKLKEVVLDSIYSPRTRKSTPSDRITPREREVIQLVAEGKSSKEIAQRLGLSPRTVDVHRAKVMQKLNVRTASELVLHAVRLQIIRP